MQTVYIATDNANEIDHMCKKPQAVGVDVVCYFCNRKAKAAPNQAGKLEVISENGWQFYPLTNDWAHTACQSQVKAPYHRLNMYTAIQSQHTRQLDKIDSERKYIATITLEADAPADIVKRVDSLRNRQSLQPTAAPKRKAAPAKKPVTPQVQPTWATGVAIATNVVAAPAPIQAAPLVTPVRKPKPARKSAPVVTVAAIAPMHEATSEAKALRVVKPKAPPVQKSAPMPPALPKRKSDNPSDACADYFGNVAKRVTALLVRWAIGYGRDQIERAIDRLRQRVAKYDR